MAKSKKLYLLMTDIYGACNTLTPTILMASPYGDILKIKSKILRESISNGAEETRECLENFDVTDKDIIPKDYDDYSLKFIDSNGNFSKVYIIQLRCDIDDNEKIYRPFKIQPEKYSYLQRL